MSASSKETFPYTSRRKGLSFRSPAPFFDIKLTFKVLPLLLVLFIGIALGLNKGPSGASRVISEKGGEYSASLEQALKMISSGDFTQAAQTASAVLRADPDNALAHHLLGLADARRGLVEEAAASFENSVELDPGFAASWYNLGMVKETRGEFTGALADFRKASELEPSNRIFSKAVDRVGQVLTGEGEWSLRESEESSLFMQGVEALDRGGDEDLVYAESVFRDLSEKRPYDVATKNMLGLTLARRGLLPEAESVLLEVVDTEPGYADAWFNLGMLHLALGRNDDALREFRTALSLADNDSLKAASEREIQSINSAESSAETNMENSETSSDEIL
jgi:Flp pilus assembly protein TadD